MKRRRPDIPRPVPMNGRENGEDPFDAVMDDLASLADQKTRLHQSGASARIGPPPPPRSEPPPPPVERPTSERYPRGASKDQYSQGQYPPDQYPQDRYPPDQYPQDRYPQDQYPQGQYPPDQYPQGQYPPDQYPQGQYPQDQHPQDRYPQGQYPQDQHPQDRYPQDRYPQDQYPQDQYPQDQYPQDQYYEDHYQRDHYQRDQYYEDHYQQDHYQQGGNSEEPYPPERYSPEGYQQVDHFQPERYRPDRSAQKSMHREDAVALELDGPTDTSGPPQAAVNGEIVSSTHFPPISPKKLFGGNLHLSTLVQKTSEQQAFAALHPVDTEAVRAAKAPAPVAAPAPTGRLIVLFSTHGGAGCTTLAANMASNLAQMGRSTCLVDLDLQLGDVLAMLSQTPRCPMSKVARNMESLDWEMLGPMLPSHTSGIRIVSQVGCLEELAELTPGRIPVLLRYLQAHFDCGIVDGVRDFNDHNLAALDVADLIILVATQDAPAIRGLSRRISIFRRLGYPMTKLKVLINRFDKKNRVSLQAIAQAVGLPPDSTVINDFKTVQYSLNSGQMLSEVAPDSQITEDVLRVTHRLFDLPEPQRKRRPTLWNRLTQKAKPDKRRVKTDKRKVKTDKRRGKPDKRRGKPDAGRKHR